MKTERFNNLVKEIREASLDTLTKKNANYATAEDRLHNFKVGAAITGGTPAQAALGYMAKHLASLQDKVARNDFHDREDLKEKIQDSINYLVFIWCCANEEMEKYKTEDKQSAIELKLKPTYRHGEWPDLTPTLTPTLTQPFMPSCIELDAALRKTEDKQ